MKQTERIRQMERRMRRLAKAAAQMEAVLDAYSQMNEDTEVLATYYASQQWRDDFEADANHLLPKTLRRGVLSEDGLWNLLEQCRELRQRLNNL